MSIPNGFHIIISSDIEYEDLCAEIYFQDEFFAIISQENGFDNLEIEIHPPACSKTYWTFRYSDFEVVLRQAKDTLWKMRKR